MRFIAEHVSFQETDDVWTFALGDNAVDQPDNWIILTFGDEEEQDCQLGLTGLYLQTSDGLQGYGLVKQLTMLSQSLLIELIEEAKTIVLEIPAQHLETAKTAAEACELANSTQSRKQA